MKTPSPGHEDHNRLSAALRRDAARVQEPPFDPALHRATLGRIVAMRGAMPGSRDARWNWWWRSALAGAAALAVLALCIGLWIPRVSQNTVQHVTQPPRDDVAAALASTQAAVAGLSSDASAPLPAWMSPTASLLDTPYLPFVNAKH